MLVIAILGTVTIFRFSDQIVAGGCFFSRQRGVFKSRLRILDLGRNILSGKKASSAKKWDPCDYFGGKKKLSGEHF